MEKFAKLFESEVYGQILVLMDTEEGDPVLKISVCPPGLGVCSCTIKFEDDDADLDDQEKAFSEFTQEMGEEIAASIFENSAPIAAAFS